MVSREQKRVWKYVEERRFLKLRTFLREHRDLNVNFSGGRWGWSPLQLACCLGDGAVLQLLLKHGADILHRDREGNTALHLVIKRILQHENSVHVDLLLPLKIRCPAALKVPNNYGVTPQDLLNEWNHTETGENFKDPTDSDAERKWQENPFAEWEDKFFHRSRLDNDKEHFGDWADRCRSEYFNKKQAEGQRPAEWFAQRRKERQERQHKEEMLRQLKREEKEDPKRAKKRKYDDMCAATFDVGSSSGDTKLSYSDIPWPAPRGTVQEMLDVMLHGLDRNNVPVFRKMLRKQQALWHPDKFSQRCEDRLEEKDKQRILETVTALSQELNRLAQSLRT